MCPCHTDEPRLSDALGFKAGGGQQTMGFGGQPAAQVGRQNSGPIASPQLPPGAGQRQVRLFPDCGGQ